MTLQADPYDPSTYEPPPAPLYAPDGGVPKYLTPLTLLLAGIAGAGVYFYFRRR